MDTIKYNDAFDEPVLQNAPPPLQIKECEAPPQHQGMHTPPPNIGLNDLQGEVGGIVEEMRDIKTGLGPVQVFLLKEQSIKKVYLSFPLNMHKFSLHICLIINLLMERYALVLNPACGKLHRRSVSLIELE